MSLIIKGKLEKDWFQNLEKKPLEWMLLQEEDTLQFRARRSLVGKPHPDARPGEFLAELWRYEVAELFLRDLQTGQYFEFNLATNGGWWACQFAAPRQICEEQPDFTQVCASSETSPDGWAAQLSIPTDLFSSLDSLEYNVTAILGSEPQRFYSHAPLPGETPDYHQPTAFLPLPPSEGS